jgi:hypothetical protein
LCELFFSGKAKQQEQELEKQNFCDFSIEEMPDYFRHGQSENNCRHRESETLVEKCPKNGTFFVNLRYLRGCAVPLVAEIAIKSRN